jgi:hypothetical protein
VKVDPSTVSDSVDLSDCPSYEGYVLEENFSTIKIIKLQPEIGIEDVPVDRVECMDDEEDNNIISLKMFILNKLDLCENNPLTQQILNCNSLDEIEVFLQQAGYSESEIVEIYREYIMQ